MPIRPTQDAEILAMKGIHLWHYSKSNCSMRARLMLEEKRLPWTSHYLDLAKQENHSDFYFKIHPHALVPAIVNNGEIVHESADILRYLEGKFPEIPMIPADPDRKAEMEGWLDICSRIHVPIIKTYMYGVTKGRNQTEESIEAYAARQSNQELVQFHRMTLSEGHIPQNKIDYAAGQLHGYFQRLEDNLGKYKFMVCDHVSLADIAWIPQYSLLGWGGFPFEEYPRLLRWAEDFKVRPSYHAAITQWFNYDDPITDYQGKDV